MAKARDEALVRQKVDFLRKTAFWPIHSDIDEYGWLSNFEDDERPFAVALLDAFLYLSDDMTSTILASEFHRLSQIVCPADEPLEGRIASWDTFTDRVIVTYPTDEEPGATDSGRSYLRKARGKLNLREDQFCDPHDALHKLAIDPSAPVVFIDDFTGTGNQFLQTWGRRYTTPGGTRSFAEFQPDNQFYVPILCTETGVTAISNVAPSLLLRPGHILAHEYSIFHKESLVWPDDLMADGPDAIKQASKRAGIPMGGGSIPHDWCGFGGLGLCVAIDDTIPDASLTLFYWEENGWRPLKRRP